MYIFKILDTPEVFTALVHDLTWRVEGSLGWCPDHLGTKSSQNRHLETRVERAGQIKDVLKYKGAS